jgi:hypothetical protein
VGKTFENFTVNGRTPILRCHSVNNFQVPNHAELSSGPTSAGAPAGQSPAIETGQAALLAELKATFDRILTTIDGDQAATRPTAAPGGKPVDETDASDTPGVAEIKRLLKLRANRRRKTVGEFFEWPAWDMLLDLAAVRAEGGHVSVSSVCISSGAPQSTALRKLAALENAKLVRRYFHGPDRRRVCIALTDEAAEMVNAALREEAAFYQGFASSR